MNLYFLVEGRRTEKKLYPAWLKQLLPLHTQVDVPDEVTQNSYYLISGEGYPRLLDVALPNAIDDIRDVDKFGYLIICLDADEESVETMNTLVMNRIQTAHAQLPGFTIPRVVVQNRCIESWLLGNRSMIPRRQNPKVHSHFEYYNVYENCPEKMGKNDFTTHAAYHLDYLKAIFNSRQLTYSKQLPGITADSHYLAELVARAGHIPQMESFKVFLDLCASIRQHSPGYDSILQTGQ